MKLIKSELNPEALCVEETLFHVANGYLGVRGNFEEGYPEQVPSIRGCYINGYYDTVDIKYHERLYGFPEKGQRMVNLPDVQTTRLWVDGEEFSPFAGQLDSYERVLDTEAGNTLRDMKWRSPAGRQAEVSVLRMASFVRPELFLTIYEVVLPQGGEVVLQSEVDCNVSNFVDPGDPRVASEHQRHIFFDGAELLEDGGLARCHTGESRLDMAVCQRHVLGHSGKVEIEATPAGFYTRVKAVVEPGAVLRVEKYTLLSDARRQEHPTAHVYEAATQCIYAGAETLLVEQRQYMEKFWKTARVGIEGNEEMAEGMDFNLYMLLQSAGRDSISNVSAKGLSGEGYEGHYFWDTEIYIFPFFLFTQPALAQRLLDFRYSVLDGARQHAQTLGHKRGALYPWRTITGSECSSYFPSGSAQYHITGDVAHSFMQYYQVTGDLAYMAEKGAEVLLETARVWLEVGHYDRQGRFCIEDVTGPDEYTCIVNNNYYTNLIAKHNLCDAVEVYSALREQGLHKTVRDKIGFDEAELQDFMRACEAMYLPYDEALGIPAQDDAFLEKPVWDFAGTPSKNYPLLLHYYPLTLYRHQVCKQADTVLAHYLFEEGLDEATLRRSYEYYERITTHDSSLSTCVYSIMASRLGLVDKAYNYFIETIRTDLDNAHKNTKDGIHTANMGGAYLGLVAGFAGLRVQGDGLHFQFCVPPQWQGYHFKIWYRGSLLAFHVKQSEVTITVEQGQPTTVFVGGKPYVVEGTQRLVGVAK